MCRNKLTKCNLVCILFSVISSILAERTQHFEDDQHSHVEQLKLNLKELENKFKNFQTSMEEEFEKLRYENRLLKEVVGKQFIPSDLFNKLFKENQDLEDVKVKSSSEELQPSFKTVQPSITITASNLFICQQKLDELEELALGTAKELKSQKLQMAKISEQHQSTISTYNNSINSIDELKETVSDVSKTLQEEQLKIAVMSKIQNGHVVHINNNYQQIQEVKEILQTGMRKTHVLEIGHKNHTELLQNHQLQQNDLQINLNLLNETIHESIFIWKLENFSTHLQNGITGRKKILDSEPFYTSAYGYKMGISVYPNGDYPSNGTHLSLYFQLMKGPMDDILQWPFTYKITLAILDQGPNEKKFHRQLTLKPGPDFPDFQKPRNERNNKRGFPGMIPHKDLLRSNQYLQNDCIFIKVTVHT